MEGLAAPTHGITGGLKETADLVMFKHTVFALPFALMSLITAPGAGWPQPHVWLWVLVAMVAARTAAMAFNRIVDHEIDARNPRTSGRTLPAGRLSRRFVWGLTAASCVVFVVAAAQLNRLCLMLALPTLAVLLGYSFSKRFTPLAHLWLGSALGLAPIGAWIAATGQLALPPVILGVGVMFWVAGFDVIYSLQDQAFDREHHLHSLPARLGAARALMASRLFHIFALSAFAVFASMAGGGWLRYLAVAAAAVLLNLQHLLVSANDLRRVNAAFFSANGVLAAVMFALFLAAKLSST